MRRDLLLGHWTIVHWLEIYEDGRTIAPFGEDLRGFLHYTADGFMMCAISKPQRALFTSDHQFEATNAEKAQAYDDFFTYAGRYEHDENKLAHFVEHALFPNWQNTVQYRRIAQLSADHLCLEADKKGALISPHIVRILWRK